MESAGVFGLSGIEGEAGELVFYICIEGPSTPLLIFFLTNYFLYIKISYFYKIVNDFLLPYVKSKRAGQGGDFF